MEVAQQDSFRKGAFCFIVSETFAQKSFFACSYFTSPHEIHQIILSGPLEICFGSTSLCLVNLYPLRDVR